MKRRSLSLSRPSQFARSISFSSPGEPDDDRLRLDAVVDHQPRPGCGPQERLVEPERAEGVDLGGEDDAEGREGRR